MKKIPSPSEYVIAFKKMDVSDLQMRMLEIHYQAPSYTLTATEMANALGYPHYSVSNGNYGRLGTRLGDALGWKPDGSDHGVSVLVTFAKPENNWQWIMRPEVITALEKLEWVSPSTTAFPNEVEESITLVEGAVKRVSVNAYERNPAARSKCIAHYGHKCAACGILLSDLYGDIADNYIHIHHLKQLSDIGEEYKIDPISDLRPVCPNCHAMMHRKNPPYSIKEIAEIYRTKKCEQGHTL